MVCHVHPIRRLTGKHVEKASFECPSTQQVLVLKHNHSEDTSTSATFGKTVHVIHPQDTFEYATPIPVFDRAAWAPRCTLCRL